MKKLLFIPLLLICSLCFADVYYVVISKRDEGDLHKGDIVSIQTTRPNNTEFETYSIIKTEMTKKQAEEYTKPEYTDEALNISRMRKYAIDLKTVTTSTYEKDVKITLPIVSVVSAVNP